MSLAIESIQPEIMPYKNQAVSPSFQMKAVPNNKQDNKNQQPSFKELSPKALAICAVIGAFLWVVIIEGIRFALYGHL